MHHVSAISFFLDIFYFLLVVKFHFVRLSQSDWNAKIYLWLNAMSATLCQMQWTRDTEKTTKEVKKLNKHCHRWRNCNYRNVMQSFPPPVNERQK